MAFPVGKICRGGRDRDAYSDPMFVFFCVCLFCVSICDFFVSCFFCVSMCFVSTELWLSLGKNLQQEERERP